MATKRILVVDDSPTQLESARAALEPHGFTVHTASGGEEALTKAREGAFDLVLTDVVMPGMSGFELCTRLKQEIAEPPPVVLLTSLHDPRDIVRGIESGADNYITKPYSPEHLAQRARQVIEGGLADQSGGDGPHTIRFLGESYTITSNPPQILALLLSSFEELIRTNGALQESQRQLAESHERELRGEQEARARAEADTRRMEQLMQRAEAATRARDEVLAMVSHDLRNPVGTIFTSASLLLEMELPPEAHRRQLEIIRRTSRAMDRLIQDLLDASSLESGRFSIDTRPESARALVLEAIELHAGIAASRGIELSHELDGGDIEVEVDHDRIRQVFFNLIGNALKFTPPGGSVVVGCDRAGDMVHFSVRDSGPGIEPEALPHIFDRFWKGGEGGGSGLGLFIAKGIVEAHSGQIWAQAGAQGSTFVFTLPMA